VFLVRNKLISFLSLDMNYQKTYSFLYLYCILLPAGIVGTVFFNFFCNGRNENNIAGTHIFSYRM
jgi:hypothetical protein